MENILSEIYYSSAFGFGGIKKLYKKAKKQVPGLKLKQVKTWLSKQPTYSLHVERNRKPRRRKYWSPGPFVMVELDLGFMSGASSNYNRPGFLLCIDIFSRYIFAKSIKSKQTKHIVSLLKEILDDDRLKPLESVRSDQGGEFKSRLMSDMLVERGVAQYVTASHSRTKAALAERGVGEIKRRLVKMRDYARRTRPRRPRARWLDLLDEAVLNYNLSPHSSLAGYSPDFASRAENTQLIMDIQNSRMPQRQIPIDYLRQGTKVRVRYKPGSFGMRVDENQASDEIYRISRVFAGVPEIYQIKDQDHNVITGKFYKEDFVIIK